MNKIMKDSGIEYIGKIPNTWKLIRMKDCSYMKGRIGWQGLTADEFIDEGPYLVTGTDFDNGRVDWNRSYHISEKRYNEATPIQLRVDDLLVTKDGTIGKLAYIDYLPGKASLNSHLLVIRPLNNIFINKYLYWVLSSSIFEGYYKLVANGSTMDSLSQEKIGEFKFYIPYIKEQELIADYLEKKCSEIDGIISKIEKQIEKLNDYKKSLIHECVTKGLNKNVEFKESGVNWIGHIPENWSVNKIKYLATEKDTIFIDGDWIESDVICDEGIRYLTTGNVGAGFFKVQGDSYISQKTFNNLHCLNVVPGDLMISRLNEPIARACLVPDDEDRYVVAVDNVILRPNSDIDKKYLMYVMNSDGYSSLANITARGSTMSRISRTQLGQFFVPIPTYDEQKLIANYLDRQCEKINAIISKKQKQLLDIKQYKSSLIYEYVTGKKRVKVGE